MLRVVGRKVDSTKQNVGYLVFNESDTKAPAQWVAPEQMKELLKKYNFSNFNKRFQSTDSKEGSFSSIPIYSAKNTITNKKKAILLWGYTKDGTPQGYALYLPTGMVTVTVKDFPNFVSTHGLINASYCTTNDTIRLAKGRLRMLPLMVVTDPDQPKKPEAPKQPEQSKAPVNDDSDTLVGGSPSKVAEIITDKIIAQLEKGVIPWQKPWIGNKGVRNYVSQKPYRGVNVFLLTEPGEYITKKQIGELQKKDPSIKLNDGALWEMIVFWQYKDKKKPSTKAKGSKSDDDDDDDDTQKTYKQAILRYYYVTHIKNVSGIESKLPKVEQLPDFIKHELADQTIQSYVTKHGFDLQHVKGGNEAYYRPSTKEIVLPAREQFKAEEKYYGVAFHECMHSTGSLLGRDLSGGMRSNSYSKEELVAEIGACMLLVELGMEPTIENSSAYIKSWLRALQGNKNILPTIASLSQKGVDLILESKPANVPTTPVPITTS